MVLDENSMKDPLCNSATGSMVSLDYVTPDTISTSQHPKQNVTPTSMLPIPLTLAVGKSRRISEQAPPPQPSERASSKRTLEQARLAGLTDEEVANIAVALKPVFEEVWRLWPIRETWGLPETSSSQTIKRGKSGLGPSSNPERATPMKHDEYCAHDHLTHAGSTSTPATVTVPSTESSTTTSTQTVVTFLRTRKPPALPPATQFLSTGQHPRTTNREETLRVLMHETKCSANSNMDTNVADYDDHRWLLSTKFA